MDIGLSIVLCTYNGGKRIQPVLSSLENQIVEFPLELVIVDNNSIDDSVSLIRNQLVNSCLKWKIVKEENPGLVHARWKGINESIFDFILFCDDDTCLSPEYCRKGIEIFSTNVDVGIIGGIGSLKIETLVPSWFRYFSHSYAIGNLGKSTGNQPKLSYHYGAGIFFKRRPLLELQELGFKSILKGREKEILSGGEDIELCFALQLMGYDLWFDESLTFDHLISPERLTWKYYLRLKEGIASSFPLLLSYEGLFFGIKEEREFKNYLRKKFILALKGYVLTSARFLVNPKSKINQVQRIETKTKVFSYFRNRNKTKEAFKSLRKIFK